MGILSTPELIRCSASELIGQYVGATVPKTRFQLQKALGKVLSIDAAYWFGSGSYATEAVNELIHCLSAPKFMGKISWIYARYGSPAENAIRAGWSLHPRSRIQHSTRRLYYHSPAGT